MGTGEVSSPAKSSKPTSTSQEAPPAPSYADWSASMQAYYAAGAAPPPFFTNTAASPAPHPYLWGGQHPIIPPYGAPVPYPAFYPPGGICAHPNMPMSPSAANANMEMVEKTIERKGQTSMKKSNIISGVKAGESGKATSGSGNDGASRSAESGSEGSSDASDENNDHQESAGTKKRSFNQMLADGANAQNGTVNENIQIPVQGQLVASMPATNLNIGMELWNASPAGIGAVKMRPNPSGISPTATAPTMVGREIQDERELKRQKRKQSNRESARRSRLRKQAECEELQARVETLSTENHTLRDELQKLSEECEKLTSENNSIKDELTRICGPDALSNKDDSDSTPVPQSCCGGEGKS